MWNGFWSCEGRVANNGVDVGLGVGVAVVRAWSGLLFFVKSGRGNHNVIMSVCWVRWVVKCVGVVCVELCCRTKVRVESVGR